MKELESQISRINSKIQEVLKKYAGMQDNLDKQSKTILRLEKENSLKDSTIRMMEEQQYILKSAAGEMNGKDKKEFEKLINNYLREIEKCIKFLND